MSLHRGEFINWALDALKVTVAWLAAVYVAPMLEPLTGPIPDIVVEFFVTFVAVLIGNCVLNIVFGLPQIKITWRDPDNKEITGTDLSVIEGEPVFHSMQAMYDCRTFLAKRINAYLAKQARLVIEFDPSAVRVTPEVGLTREGMTLESQKGRVLLPLNSTVVNGPVTWCAVQIEPLSVHNGYEGQISYRIEGQGAAMVFWGWVIRPRTSVRIIHVSRS